MTKSKGTAANHRSPVSWDHFVANCTPSVWRMRVHAVELDSGTVAAALQTTLPFPTDRDVARAIGGAFGEPGRFRVSLLARVTLSAQVEADRARLGVGAKHLPRAIVEVTASDVERGAAVPRQAPARGPGGRPAVDADPELIEAEKRARLAKARQAEAIADAAARKAERSDGHDGAAALAPLLARLVEQQQAPKTDNGVAAIMQVLQAGQAQMQALMMQLLQQSQQREQALLAALSEQRTPANLPELDNVKRTIETFQGLRELLRAERVDDDRPRDLSETIVEALAPQLGQLLPQLLGRGAPPAPQASAAPPALAAVPAVPAAPAWPADRSIGAQRVQLFVRAVVTEALAGSSPEALADRLADDVDALPAAVRGELDAGNLDNAIAVILSYLSDDESRNTLQAVAVDKNVRPWLLAFVAACSTEPDDEQETA